MKDKWQCTYHTTQPKQQLYVHTVYTEFLLKLKKENSSHPIFDVFAELSENKKKNRNLKGINMYIAYPCLIQYLCQLSKTRELMNLMGAPFFLKHAKHVSGKNKIKFFLSVPF